MFWLILRKDLGSISKGLLAFSVASLWILANSCVTWLTTMSPVSMQRWYLWLHFPMSHLRALLSIISAWPATPVKTAMQCRHTVSPRRATCCSRDLRRRSEKNECALTTTRKTCGPGKQESTLLTISLFTTAAVFSVPKSHHQPGVSTTEIHLPATTPRLLEQVILSLVTNSSLPRMMLPTKLLPQFRPPRRTIFRCELEPSSPKTEKREV